MNLMQLGQIANVKQEFSKYIEGRWWQQLSQPR